MDRPTRGRGESTAVPSWPLLAAAVSTRGTWTASAWVTALTVLGQLPAFIVPLATARMLGATPATDAFFLAFALVSFVINAEAGATQHALVPFLARMEDSRARALVATVQTLVLAATVAALGVEMLTIAPHGTVKLIVALMPFALAAALCSVWTGALYGRRSFAAASLSPGVRGLGVLVAIVLLSGRYGVGALLIGYSVAEFFRLWLLARAVEAPRTAWRPDPRIAEDLRAFARTGGAQAAGSAVVALLPVIDRFMAAASLPAGSVSLLDYADRVWQVPVGLLMSGFLVVSLAQWSHDVAAGHSTAALATKTRRSAIVISAASVVPLALLIVFRAQLATVLFGRTHLAAADVAVLGDLLGAYFIGVPIYLAGLTYARAFIVLGRTEWLLAVGIVQLVAKVVLNSVFTRSLGLPGMALATSAVYVLASLAHIWRLHSSATRDAGVA